MSRLRAYVKPFTADGSAYASDWTEVTKDVARALGGFTQRLEISDYDLGGVNTSSMGVKFQNTAGKYSDPDEDGASIFTYKRKDALFRLTWDLAEYDAIAGDIDAGVTFLTNETEIFKGLIDDLGTSMDLRSYFAKVKILGREILLKNATVDLTALGISNGDTVSEIMLAILDQKAVTDGPSATSQAYSLLTVTAGNINPGYDAVVDDVSDFDNKSVKSVMQTLLLISQSIMYIDGDTLIVSNRDPSASVAFTFYGVDAANPTNLAEVKNIRRGVNRLFNYWTWRDSSAIAQTSDTVSKYGARVKQLNVDAVTTLATQQSILDALNTEFGNIRRELTVVTPMTYDTLALKMLDKVNFDVPPVLLGAGALPQYEIAEYEVAEYPGELTFSLQSTDEFKIIGRKVKPIEGMIEFDLREVV